MSDTVNHVSIALTATDEIIAEREKRRTWLSIIREFGLNTTAHGLPRIMRSESIHNRVYWSLASISFMAIMIYFIIRAVIAYLDYPTQIDVSIDIEWPQRFPALTFCNAGGIRLDKFIGPFSNYTNTFNVTNTDDTFNVHPNQIPFIGTFVRDLLNGNQSLEPFFYSLSSMLYSCTYNSQPCTEADFISFVTTKYGFCYTFNAKLNNQSEDSIRDGTEYDGTGKLELGLYVHSHQYVPYLTDSVGIVALIHDNTQVPLMETSGLNLIPGQKHKFSYRKKTNSFLHSPYTSCTDQIQPWMQTMFDNYPQSDYRYSQSLCFKLSIQIYTYEQCGCVNPAIWDIRSIVLPDIDHVIVAPLCSMTDLCFVTAASAYMNSSANSNTLVTNCPRECLLIDFIVKKSSLSTPVSWQYFGIKKFVEDSLIPTPLDWSTTCREYISTNYVALSIVRETLVVENNIQQASLSLLDVLSNIGGQTGLWLGISLLSIMELFEMLYRLVRYQCHAIRAIIQK